MRRVSASTSLKTLHCEMRPKRTTSVGIPALLHPLLVDSHRYASKEYVICCLRILGTHSDDEHNQERSEDYVKKAFPDLALRCHSTGMVVALLLEDLIGEADAEVDGDGCYFKHVRWVEPEEVGDDQRHNDCLGDFDDLCEGHFWCSWLGKSEVSAGLLTC